ncbi:cold shock domain-containing protein [Bradyrhizobium elkanii]|nr:cold shock domain-containing protein [Bradyrhizobium elkanii]WLA39473.1 cold shock domain-containing protein [Bradyrhizobium elkanii]
MPNGVITFHNRLRYFAWISPDSFAADDVFARAADLPDIDEDELVGSRVSFDVVESGEKRARAINITVLAGPAWNDGVLLNEHFNDDFTRGFGFIRPLQGQGNIFVGATAVQRADVALIRKGSHVEYVLNPRPIDPLRPSAIACRVMR